MSDAVLDSLLLLIRQHEGLPALLKAVQRPRIQPFKLTEAEKSETARARFIFQSGQLHSHNQWLGLLSGNAEIGEQENL